MAKAGTLACLALLAACTKAAPPSEPHLHGAGTPCHVIENFKAPTLLGRVSDHADIFDSEDEREISDLSERMEDATGHQVVVASVPSLEGHDIADYGCTLGGAWGIGRKDYDDGLVILLAPNERQVRIAVGYGLETTVTDEEAADMIETAMKPYFVHEEYGDGVISALAMIEQEFREGP